MTPAPKLVSEDAAMNIVCEENGMDRALVVLSGDGQRTMKIFAIMSMINDSRVKKISKCISSASRALVALGFGADSAAESGVALILLLGLKVAIITVVEQMSKKGV